MCIFDFKFGQVNKQTEGLYGTQFFKYGTLNFNQTLIENYGQFQFKYVLKFKF
jgi:hypothetical protein